MASSIITQGQTIHWLNGFHSLTSSWRICYLKTLLFLPHHKFLPHYWNITVNIHMYYNITHFKKKLPRFHFFSKLLGLFYASFYSKLLEGIVYTSYFYFLTSHFFFACNFNLSTGTLLKPIMSCILPNPMISFVCQFLSYSRLFLAFFNWLCLLPWSMFSLALGTKHNPSFSSNSLATP